MHCFEDLRMWCRKIAMLTALYQILENVHRIIFM